MIHKKILFLTICFIGLIGCGNSQSDNSKIDFKNYFFQPDWFKEPKIYEYEITSTAKSEKYNAYRYFERISDNQLKHIIYDNDFNQLSIVIYEYLPDKTIIKEITTFETWNNNNPVQEKLTDNVVFDYNKLNEQFGFTHTSRFEGYSDLTKYVTRTLKKTEKRKFNGKDVDVVIADGNTKVIVKTDSEEITLHNDEVLIYADNIGVIYQDYKNQSVEVVTELTRILSKDEFDKMKNAR